MTEPLVLPGAEGAITVAPIALERLVVQAAQSVQGARVLRPKRSVEVVHGAGRA